MTWTNYIGQFAVLALMVIIGASFAVRSWRNRSRPLPLPPRAVVDVDFEEVQPPPLMAPNARRQQYFERMRQRGSRTRERRLLLEPNMDSDVKVERYAVGVEFVIKVGTPMVLKEDNFSPDVNFRVDTFSANVPAPNLVRMLDFQTANVTTICVGGLLTAPSVPSPTAKEMKVLTDVEVFGVCRSALDLWHFREPKPGLLDMPTMTPANKFRFLGYYNGRPIDGYKDGDEFRLSVMLAGNASLVA